MTNTGILESVPIMRQIFLVTFLGPGAGVEGVHCGLHNLLSGMSFNALIFVCVSSCMSPLLFVFTLYNKANQFFHFKVKQYH